MAQLQFLTVDRLTAIRGQRVLFRDLSFRVQAGQVLSLEGPNGAGKTTLLRMIAGLMAPAAGTIAIATDADVADDSEERGKRIGWLGHLDGAKSQLTPREALAFYARLYDTHGAIDEALALAGLTKIADLPCQYLSAGQKKRLALARLKLSGRAVWLLDEPLSSLDAEGRKLVAEIVSAHRLYGGIVIAATHEPLGVECVRMTLGGGA
ncbi:MAG: heme ABC exporter ATP-binding protein CcmA [Proteobacteria bacterium]|nr:heme ABC exporter ATP-binding protein CcmA [Pseudomonadota bacterium]